MWEEKLYNSKGNVVGYLQDDGEKYHLLNSKKELVSRIPKENLIMINSIMIMLNENGIEEEKDLDTIDLPNFKFRMGPLLQHTDTYASITCMVGSTPIMTMSFDKSSSGGYRTRIMAPQGITLKLDPKIYDSIDEAIKAARKMASFILENWALKVE